jgi:hypothetical protein
MRHFRCVHWTLQSDATISLFICPYKLILSPGISFVKTQNLVVYLQDIVAWLLATGC